MRRFLASLWLLLSALTMSGCAGLYSNVREVEDLLVIQTMGLDDDPAGIRLTLASGAGVRTDGEPLRLEGRGPSVTAAIERIRSRASEEELFCAHISHVLLGEEAARGGLEPILAYICRSPELRISVPLYVLRGGEAGEAVLRVGDERFGICDALDSVNGDVKLRGDGHVYSAADVVRSLARQGSALLCAVELLPSAEQDGESPLMTVAPNGYGVLDREGRLCAWIDREDAVGADLLLDQSGPCELVVTDRTGERVTLSLERGESEIRAVWDEAGRLSELEISVTAEASVAETVRLSGTDKDELLSLLEAALSARLAAVLQLSKRLKADFLGLGSRVELASPTRWAALDRPFPELLETLPLRLSVSARLVHSNDVEGGKQ